MDCKGRKKESNIGGGVRMVCPTLPALGSTPVPRLPSGGQTSLNPPPPTHVRFYYSIINGSLNKKQLSNFTLSHNQGVSSINSSLLTIWPYPFGFLFFFSVRLLSVLRGHSVFSSPPQRPMTSDFEGSSIADFIHYIFFPYINSSIPCEMLVVK